MKSVDTIKWKHFKLCDLFDKLDLKCKKKGFNKAFDISTEKNDEFSLPLVNAKHSNNGIMYYGRKADFDYAEMTLDVVADGAASTGDVYPQPQETGVLYNAYLIKPKIDGISNLVLCFLATVVQKCIKHKYGYDNKAGWSKVKNEQISLPVDEDGEPDWKFMENYMAEIRDVCATRESDLNILRKITPQKLQVKQWKTFKLGGTNGIFKIHKGTRLTKANMKEGDYPFVGASAKCNGITRFVGNEENLITGNKITINYNGSIGESFWQDKDFLASDDVNWCEPNTEAFPNFKLNRYVAHFLCSITKRLGKRYQYIDKWTKDNMEKDLIMLPVSENGEPDWEYMETYMREIESQCNEKLDTLMSIM